MGLIVLLLCFFFSVWKCWKSTVFNNPLPSSTLKSRSEESKTLGAVSGVSSSPQVVLILPQTSRLSWFCFNFFYFAYIWIFFKLDSFIHPRKKFMYVRQSPVYKISGQTDIFFKLRENSWYIYVNQSVGRLRIISDLARYPKEIDILHFVFQTNLKIFRNINLLKNIIFCLISNWS